LSTLAPPIRERSGASQHFVNVLVRSQSLEAGELTWTGLDPLYPDFWGGGSLMPKQELLLLVSSD